MVMVSVLASGVRVTLEPAARVSVSERSSATISVPSTSMTPKFWDVAEITLPLMAMPSPAVYAPVAASISRLVE